MTSIAINTLEIVRKLRTSGYTEQQAEAQADVLAEVIEQNLATKQDIKELEYRLTIKMGAMLVAAVSVLAILIKIV